MHRGTRLAVTAVLLLAGCSGQTVVASPDAAPVDGSLDATLPDATADAATPDSRPEAAPGDAPGGGPCPAAPPSAGASCSPNNLTCEYAGSDPHLYCDTTSYVCTTGSWTANGPTPCMTNDPSCPSSFNALMNGSACPSSGGSLSCSYAEGLCDCAPCIPETGTVQREWECSAWTSAPPGCPSPRPLLGTPCSQDGQGCNYGVCAPVPLGPNEICTGGVWTQAIGGAACAIPACN